MIATLVTFSGEFTDPDLPAPAGTGISEVVRPVQTLEFIEERSALEPEVSFTILLRNRQVVNVDGNHLEWLRVSESTTDAGSYAVISRVNGRDLTVALFPASEVTGIFRGQLHPNA